MAYADGQFNNGSYSAKPAASTEVFSVTINPEVGYYTHSCFFHFFIMGFKFVQFFQLVNLFWGLYKRTESSNVAGTDGGGPSIEGTSLPFFIEPISSSQSTSVQQSQYFIFGYQLPIDADDSFTKNILNVLRHSGNEITVHNPPGFGSNLRQ